MSQGLEDYYSDTDSLVVSGPLPADLIDEAELGKMKVEHRIEEGYFVAPKIYWLKDADTGAEVVKCKGYPGELTKGQIETLFYNQPLELSITKWVRSLGQQSVGIQLNQAYKIEPEFNKRTKDFEEGVWVDTKPLILGK